MTKHPAYAVWRSMLARCLNDEHYAFHNYGGRGIGVCRRWRQSFDNFWADMEAGYAPGLTLDRIDNNAGYHPSNCRWTDRITQATNRRDARLVTYNGKRMNVSVAARESGVNATTILYRISHGWPESKLFIKPDFKNRPEKQS